MGRLTKQRGCVGQSSFTATAIFLQTGLDFSNRVSKTLPVRIKSCVITSISLQRATLFLDYQLNTCRLRSTDLTQVLLLLLYVRRVKRPLNMSNVSVRGKVCIWSFTFFNLIIRLFWV